MNSKLSRPLAIVGNLNVDLWVRTVSRFPRWDEELVVDSAQMVLAGTAGYIMLAAKGLGIPTFTISTIGNDAFGRFLLEEMKNHGLSCEGVIVMEGEETSLGIIFVGDKGQRGILSTLGAHSKMDLTLVRSRDSLISSCEEIFLCGNYLLPLMSPSHIQDFAKELQERGQIVFFDPSWDPSGWTDVTRKSTYSLLQHVDVYLPNQEELLHLTAKNSLDEALQEIRPRIAGEAVIKMGERGALYINKSEEIYFEGFRVEAVNTVGAGDVFDLGYLYARRCGWPPYQRLQFACALAAMVISQHRDRQYPKLSEVLNFLQKKTHDNFWDF
ncbi:PfkB domain protein [Thermobaculum terrenum ATCC BAA-798]|uniref:PfkB domain protein n=1 Tax=Thermobaculum terrenum (strain ATCC BAA-798 / CCMEE 7001 / YNP1) TaxID=525904 RepID=D1CDQ6_THET1|nr:carbohydrate kinase family protein [Thermobaculum terrenum]ACZ41062.1 PfkB domain protein [Thermobaculum terrenum ATCC BAA-798]